MEFHSSSFATNLENLLTPKWMEEPDHFVMQSKMTVKGHDRVHQLMNNKFGRFA